MTANAASDGRSVQSGLFNDRCHLGAKSTTTDRTGMPDRNLSTSARRILEQMRLAEDNFLTASQARSKQFAVHELLNAGLIKDTFREGLTGYSLTRVIQTPA
jgi:hypothetical protein